MPVRWLALDIGLEIHQLNGVQKHCCLIMSLSDLQISLTVEIGRLDKRHSLRLRRGQEYQISGEEIVVVDLKKC